MLKYFVYQHVRLDKNEIFYIGIGTQPKVGLLYERAFTHYGRNPMWIKISRSSRYKVEIILETDSREIAEAKEKELIALYGRIDQGTGHLANRTDGGEKDKTKKKKNAS